MAGIPGNWLAVDEDGNSLIPDGTEKNYKLSRKCLECYQVLKSTDKGVTWVDITSHRKSDFESASNAHTTVADDNATCVMIFYRTAANPFELADNDKFIVLGKCIASNDNFYQSIAAFSSNLISKVVTSDDHSSVRFDIQAYTAGNLINQHNLYLTKGYEPVHDSHSDRLITQNPCIKSLAYLNKQGNLQVVYQEMKHNGTNWGDDNKFNVVNKQSTVTDLNGETVIVGQKRVELPYHFDGEQY